MIVWLSWLLFLIVIVVIIFLNAGMVLLFQRKEVIKEARQDRWLPAIVTIAGLSLMMYLLALIPIDIYNVSIDTDAAETRGEIIQAAYYVLYSLIFVFVFGIVPFSYFFYEEFGEDVKLRHRIFAGCRFTIFLVIIVVLMFIVGLFVRGSNPKTKENYHEFVENTFDTENRGQSAINFAIACATTIGYIFFIIYTGVGLSSLPISVFPSFSFGKKEDSGDRMHELTLNKQKQRTLSAKYKGTRMRDMYRDDEVGLLRKRERALNDRNEYLEFVKEKLGMFLIIFKPCMLILSIILFLMSALIVISVILTNTDKMVNSFCGESCGYVLSHPTLFNPIDSLLVVLSTYFPMDYIVFGVLAFYLYACTLSGLSMIGIRFLWMKLYRIKYRNTKPQGFLIGAVVCMFSLLALVNQLMTLAPQYLKFGDQTYADDLPCDFSANATKGGCTMTQIGIITGRIEANMDIFGIVYTYMTWGFVLASIGGIFLSVLCTLWRAKRPASYDSSSDEDF